MLRTVARLMLVLAHVAPHFQPRAEAAALLSVYGQKYNVDPLLVIADVEHESQWESWVINEANGTVGLMQIQPFSFKACGESHDLYSDHCANARMVLLEWDANLRIGFEDFAAARAYCVEHGHGARATQWLQLPTGWDAVRGSRCGWRAGKRLATPKQVLRLLQRRAELERIR